MQTSRLVKNSLKRALYHAFRVGQRLGVDVLPRHYYSEIPDLRYLEQTEHWREPFNLLDVNGTDLQSQLDFIARCCTEEHRKRQRTVAIHEAACRTNGADGYGPIEADFLDAFVTELQPRRIVQIGCGVSTAVCLAAAQAADFEPSILCIEPYPNEFLQRAARDGSIGLVNERVELLDQDFIAGLEDGDLLFVDSSHALGPQGEVSRIILEVLPRLKSGVWVHFHDITFPYDYPRHLLDGQLFFTHESVLLHAFLTGNARFRIAAAFSMLHHDCPDELKRYFPYYVPAQNEKGLATSEGGHFPSACYLRCL